MQRTTYEAKTQSTIYRPLLNAQHSGFKKLKGQSDPIEFAQSLLTSIYHCDFSYLRETFSISADFRH